MPCEPLPVHGLVSYVFRLVPYICYLQLNVFSCLTCHDICLDAIFCQLSIPIDFTSRNYSMA